MRIARSLVNFILFQLEKGSEPNLRKFDLAILKLASMLMQRIGIPNAELLQEEFFLDSVYLIAKSIVETPYGYPLKFTWPLVVSISLTNKCSFGCTYCYAESVPFPSNEKTISQDLITKLVRSPIPNFLITGGEPMEIENVSQVVSQILDSHKSLYLATNASVKKLEPLMQKYPGRLTVLVSVWGDKVVHDSIRGRGSFDRTIELINYLSLAPAHCALNCVIADSAMTSLDALKQIIDHYNLHRVFITRAIEIGRVSKNRVVWTNEVVERLIERFIQLEKQLGEKLFMAVPEAASFRRNSGWKNSFLKLIGLEIPKTCASGLWTMHIDWYGNCSPCFAFETKTPYGNLLDNSVDQIWQTIQLHSSKRHNMDVCHVEQPK